MKRSGGVPDSAGPGAPVPGSLCLLLSPAQGGRDCKPERDAREPMPPVPGRNVPAGGIPAGRHPRNAAERRPALRTPGTKCNRGNPRQPVKQLCRRPDQRPRRVLQGVRKARPCRQPSRPQPRQPACRRPAQKKARTRRALRPHGRTPPDGYAAAPQ